MPLDEASKMLTAMLTPVGIYIYNVLAIGLSNATDIFESCIIKSLQDSMEPSTLQMMYGYLAVTMTHSSQISLVFSIDV